MTCILNVEKNEKHPGIFIEVPTLKASCELRPEYSRVHSARRFLFFLTVQRIAILGIPGRCQYYHRTI